MLTRRSFCACALGGPALLATAGPAQAIGCDVFTPERQAGTTPDEALALLEAGNRRFLAANPVTCDLLAQVRETAHGQAPHAAILACIDSRVPPEIIFDQRIGDIFCARVAGNVVNEDIVASLEYATEAAGAKAIVVLGHGSCGAIKSAVDDVRLGDNVAALLGKFEPALATLSASDGDRSSENEALVQKVAEANARLSAESLIARSPILEARVESGELKIVAAMHDVETGAVSWLA